MRLRDLTSITVAITAAITALSASAIAPAFAQDGAEEAPPAFPETEIFLFDYDAKGSSDVLSNARNVTQRAGYDNQPFFTKDSAAFLYSRDDGDQTDIWEYDIESGEHTRITQTPQNEFSPTPSPDNQMISVVSERNRSIWQFDRSAPDQASWALEAAGVDEPVGYFARNYATGDILFWSRYGFNVTLTSASEAGAFFITGHAAPATPHLIPGSNEFSFVHRQTNGQVWIKALDPETKAVRPLTPFVGLNANYTWTPDGAILQIEEGTVFRWREGQEGWDSVADLSDHGVADANRIAVSPDGKRVAVVGVPAK